MHGALVVLCVIYLCLAKERSYYDVLEIPRNANDRQIKKAYRKLSMKLHPDKGGSDEDFAELGEAYEVLRDPEKRKIYDTRGKEGLKQKAAGGGGGNPFAQMFKGFGFGGRKDSGESRGPDVTMHLYVTLEDIYNGNEIEIGVKNMVTCPKCRGTGAENEDDVITCRACGGRGSVQKQRRIGPGFVQTYQQECGKCAGQGKIVRNKCSVCQGAKLTKGNTILDIPIEAGVPEGEKIVFENGADEQVDKAAGHLIFEVKQLQHDVFTRRSNSIDLDADLHLSLREALTGFSREIRHLDGHPVKISSTGVTQPFSVRKIRGEGMPTHNFQSDKGDMYIRFVIDFPTTLTERQKASFARIL